MNVSNKNLSIVILAAGQGTRMRSRVPKVLHPLGGRPLLAHVFETARALAPARVLAVYGHGGDTVPGAFGAEPQVTWVEQTARLGTGHALDQALPAIPDDHRVLVLYGDVPLITPDTLQALLTRAHGDCLGLLTARLPDPGGYGRIVRDERGKVLRIVEQKDATELERRIDEVNTGILCGPAGRLRGWLDRLDADNAQGEYYLTDVIAMAVAEGLPVETAHPREEAEILGVNDKVQLGALERVHQRRRAEALMAEGVTVMDPARLDVRGTVSVGRDVCLDVGVVLEGEVHLGDGVSVGANCVLRDVDIGPRTHVLPMSLLEDMSCGRGCRIGPFARVRPGTRLAEAAHVGNFVEIKNSRVGAGSKISHLSYVGDSEVGNRVNIGAGTITCNYDGANKHRTVIGDDVFIGSDTQLVAPVTIGEAATVGAGSTITKDAPAGELTLTRSKQLTIPGWKRPTKKGG